MTIGPKNPPKMLTLDAMPTSTSAPKIQKTFFSFVCVCRRNFVFVSCREKTVSRNFNQIPVDMSTCIKGVLKVKSELRLSRDTWQEEIHDLLVFEKWKTFDTIWTSTSIAVLWLILTQVPKWATVTARKTVGDHNCRGCKSLCGQRQVVPNRGLAYHETKW